MAVGNLIKDNTCFEHPEKLSFTNLRKTNKPKCFQNSVTLEAGLSDFHNMTLLVMIVFYKKKTLLHTATINIFLIRSLWLMFRIAALNEAIQGHYPTKKQFACANQAPFIIKTTIKKYEKLTT